MICPNCASSVAEDQQYCGRCGHRIKETVASLSEHITKVEAQVADMHSDGKEQKYLELEAVENVMGRVKTWTTLFLYFAGIPAALAAFAFAVMFGKGTYDLNGIAANTRTSVQAVISDARTVAAGAISTAKDAQTTSQQVSKDVQETQRHVVELKSQVESRLSQVQQLDARIKESQASVAALSATVMSQAQQVANLTQQLKAAETGKSVALIREMYPQVYGELVAGSYDGWIDPKRKKPGDIWIAIQLSINGRPDRVSDIKFADAIQSLRDNGYTVFIGGVWLSKVSGRTSTSGGAVFDQESCVRLGKATVPCILYFREDSKNKVSKLRSLVNSV